jgi:hypothetical protein
MHIGRQRQEWQTGQIRGALHETVRRPVFGCEHGCAEGAGEVEAIGESHTLEMARPICAEDDGNPDARCSNVRYGND